MYVVLLHTADDQEWRQDESVKLVVGQGEGRAFAAGGDIKGMQYTWQS